MNSQDQPVNTENIDKTLDTNDDEAVNTENHLSTDNSIDTEVQQINTEKQGNTENGDKTDWEKLMINSDDSLFEEMTQQMENKQTEDETNASKAKTPTLTPSNNAMDMEGTLPDLTNQTKNIEVVTGLLLLGAGINQSMDDIIDKKIDAEINNEELLLVDAPKLPDFTREMRKREKNKATTGSTPSKLIPTPAQTQNTKPRKRKRKILPDSESSSTDTPKSPGGRLTIMKHKLKKTPVTTTTTRKVCCTVCCMAFEDKDDLKKHHHSDHTNNQCKVCNKSFAMKKSPENTPTPILKSK